MKDKIMQEKLLEQILGNNSLSTAMKMSQSALATLEINRTAMRFANIASKYGEAVKPLEAVLKFNEFNVMAMQLTHFAHKYREAVKPLESIMKLNNINITAIQLAGIVHKYGEAVRPLESVWRVWKSVEEDKSALNIEISKMFGDSLKQMQSEQFNINLDGTVSLEHEIVSEDIAIDEVTSCMEESQIFNDVIPFEHRINNLIENAGKRHPLVSKFITQILIPFLIGVFTTILLNQPNNTEYLHNQNRQSLIKEIKKEIITKQPVDKAFLNEYRFVSVDCLNVRVNHSTNSKVITRLYFGQKVKMLYKNMNWTLIELSDDEGIIYVKGWVHTRYLKRYD